MNDTTQQHFHSHSHHSIKQLIEKNKVHYKRQRKPLTLIPSPSPSTQQTANMTANNYNTSNYKLNDTAYLHKRMPLSNK